jgi:uncharacterized protein (DUF1330 family)
MMTQAVQPVFMMVIGDVLDREKMMSYAKALGASGLYEQHQGWYAAIGKPIAVFEGEWPPERSVVLARFPSLEAAQAFWQSGSYQSGIKPLRSGAGAFTVAVFPANAAPERIEWE